MDLKYIERPFEVKAVEPDGIFSGYGSVFGNVDSYKEIVAPGAFAESLAAWKDAGKMPPVLWQHRSGEPIGPFLDMREDTHGLYVKGQLLVEDVARAKEARALMKARAVNGLSIGYVPRVDSYDKGTGIRTLTQVDLWEVSVVTFPANASAQISNIKSAVEALESLGDCERYLRDAGGFTKAAALAFVARVKSMHGRSDSDELGELQKALTRLKASFS